MMHRALAVVVGAVLGGVLATAVFTAYLTLKYPNNYRDSGMPDFAVAMILAGPIGLLAGGVVGAVVPLKKR